MATDGKKFTNRPPMMAHNKSLQSHGGMMQKNDPLAQPGEVDQGGEQEPEMGDRPMMTEHHEDGSHTTHHESGASKHHASAEDLVNHLHKHMPEEEHEMEQEFEPEYE